MYKLRLSNSCLCYTGGSEAVAAIDKKINHMIGLKHVLEMVGPLHTTLLGATQSKMLVQTREALQDPNLVSMIQMISAVIHDDAKVKKGAGAMR